MKLNISIDDVSPHPMSSVRVLDQCMDVLSIHPGVKFSLFVPVAYWRTVRPGIATSEPLYIDRYPEFCQTLASLPTSNFEVCYHGLHHGIPGKSDNDEFQHLTREEATRKFQEMFEVVHRAGLQGIFRPVFRPPAWRMSPGAIEAAKDAGIEILALSPKPYAKDTYAGSEGQFGKVVYYNCNPPFDPLSAHPTTEVVYHACEWDKNYLDKTKSKELIGWLGSTDSFRSCFMEEMFS